MLWIVTVLKRKRINTLHWKLGALTGIMVGGSNIALFKAIDWLALINRTYLVFPAVLGGSLVLYAFWQFVSKREQGNARSVAGIILGVLGIILLALK